MHISTLQRRSIVAIWLLIVIAAGPARASHIYGADFFYQHISGNSYRVSLIVYGDCGGGAFGSLRNARPRVDIWNGSTPAGTLNLTQQGDPVEVTPVCAAQRQNTTCNHPLGTIPGVSRFVYQGNWTVSGPSADWIFRFDGALPSPTANALAGRSNVITNVVNAGVTIMALEARLNNMQGPNSSPTFTTLPTPFYCINVPQQYNLGASDPDGDALRFALTPGLVSQTSGAGGGPTVSYVAPFSAQAPLATAAGSFSFSTSTGQMNFTPDLVQTSLVVQEVSESRNGVQVGSATREMTFIVLATCNNSPAQSVIDTAAGTQTGGARGTGTAFNVCAGTDSISFMINASNPARNLITASVSGAPAGAVVSVANNGTASPVIHFEWNAIPATPGIYAFFVTYSEEACPLASVQTKAFSINVALPNAASAAQTSLTHCVRKAAVQLQLRDGLLPRRVEVYRGNTLVRTFIDNTGAISDSLDAGDYRIRVSSAGLPCTTEIPLRVVDGGPYPFNPLASDQFYCQHATINPPEVASEPGTTLHWYDMNGALMSGAPQFQTAVPGHYSWLVTQRLASCESAADTFEVYVTKRPEAGFSVNPAQLCTNDTAIITFTGSIGVGPILEYHWDMNGAISDTASGPGPIRAQWRNRGVKVVSLSVSENHCASAPAVESVVVKPVPFPSFDLPQQLCQGGGVTVRQGWTELRDVDYEWSFENGGPLSGEGPHLISWNEPGTKTVRLAASLNGCSATIEKTIEVVPLPLARIENRPEAVCIGEQIELRATQEAGNRYFWKGGVNRFPVDAGASYAVQLVRPETFYLSVENAAGCIDSTSATWSELKPCCGFSYPNAFTPNGDGRNDEFRILTDGNQLEFDLSIMNRWGQRVFYGHTAAEAWNGTFNGQPCEAGAYYYVLKARCYTGKEELHKGDLTLIR